MLLLVFGLLVRSFSADAAVVGSTGHTNVTGTWKIDGVEVGNFIAYASCPQNFDLISINNIGQSVSGNTQTIQAVYKGDVTFICALYNTSNKPIYLGLKQIGFSNVNLLCNMSSAQVYPSWGKPSYSSPISFVSSQGSTSVYLTYMDEYLYHGYVSIPANSNLVCSFSVEVSVTVTAETAAMSGGTQNFESPFFTNNFRISTLNTTLSNVNAYYCGSDYVQPNIPGMLGQVDNSINDASDQAHQDSQATQDAIDEQQ